MIIIHQTGLLFFICVCLVEVTVYLITSLKIFLVGSASDFKTWYTQHITVYGSGGRCTEVFVFLCLTSDYFLTGYTSHDLTCLFVYSTFKTQDSPRKWLRNMKIFGIFSIVLEHLMESTLSDKHHSKMEVNIAKEFSVLFF